MLGLIFLAASLKAGNDLAVQRAEVVYRLVLQPLLELFGNAHRGWRTLSLSFHSLLLLCVEEESIRHLHNNDVKQILCHDSF